MNDTQGIILFDGFCNFCSASVLFIVKRDRHARFVFAASQSKEGQKILAERGIQEMAAHSIILLEKDRVYEQSEAALRIARRLRWGWPLLYGFIVLPRGLRDYVYNLIAGNRYRLFGKRDQCFIPDEEIRNRFMDSPPSP